MPGRYCPLSPARWPSWWRGCPLMSCKAGATAELIFTNRPLISSSQTRPPGQWEPGKFKISRGGGGVLMNWWILICLVTVSSLSVCGLAGLFLSIEPLLAESALQLYSSPHHRPQSNNQPSLLGLSGCLVPGDRQHTFYGSFNAQHSRFSIITLLL